MTPFHTVMICPREKADTAKKLPSRLREEVVKSGIASEYNVVSQPSNDLQVALQLCPIIFIVLSVDFLCGASSLDEAYTQLLAFCFKFLENPTAPVLPIIIGESPEFDSPRALKQFIDQCLGEELNAKHPLLPLLNKLLSNNFECLCFSNFDPSHIFSQLKQSLKPIVEQRFSSNTLISEPFLEEFEAMSLARGNYLTTIFPYRPPLHLMP